MRMIRTKIVFGTLAMVILTVSVAVAQNGGVSSGYPTPKNGFNASQQRGTRAVSALLRAAVTECKAMATARTRPISTPSRGTLWRLRSSAGPRRRAPCHWTRI